VVVEIS